MLAVCPTVFLSCQTAKMAPNLEERIQQLCSRVLATEDDEELHRLCMELRDALNDHVRQLRQKVGKYRDSLNHAPKEGEPGDVG
jgi:signal transduction histidine kinase